jgi:hypothetical protein
MVIVLTAVMTSLSGPITTQDFVFRCAADHIFSIGSVGVSEQSL